jgi:hypothetical protein
MKTFITSMKLSDLDNLEEVFATLTKNGWIIPGWLTGARNFYLEFYPE